MRSQHIKMTWEEFERLPFKPGWKYEYAHGHAHITPRHNLVIVRADVTPRHVSTPFHLQTVEQSQNAKLFSAFMDAFADTVEYCDWKYDQIEAAAQKCVDDYFAGKRGTPHPASRVATHPSEEGMISGAALLVQKPDGAVLDLLFVRPRFQRHGLATALVQTAMNELYDSGAQSLRSAHRLCNEQSACWHKQFGFTEEPDLSVVRLRYRSAQQELFRAEAVSSPHEREQLQRERDKWQARVEALEAMADREGFEAVAPVLRYE